MDLIGRDGYQQVGSRLHRILGCGHRLDVFQKQLCMVQKIGLTRVEVSICRDAIYKYRPFDPSSKTLWHLTADRNIKALAGQVLNDENICRASYR